MVENLFDLAEYEYEYETCLVAELRGPAYVKTASPTTPNPPSVECRVPAECPPSERRVQSSVRRVSVQCRRVSIECHRWTLDVT